VGVVGLVGLVGEVGSVVVVSLPPLPPPPPQPAMMAAKANAKVLRFDASHACDVMLYYLQKTWPPRRGTVAACWPCRAAGLHPDVLTTCDTAGQRDA
jgi:hypothetical protein